MFHLRVLFCYLSFVVLTPHLTNAMTEEQEAKIHEQFEKLVMQCIEDFPITEEDMNNFRDNKMGTNENASCFLACVMKKGGVMDDDGMVQHETTIERAKEIFDDPEEIQNIKDYLHSCSHVNSIPVRDGNKGCERASLSFTCMVENASKFGFDV